MPESRWLLLSVLVLAPSLAPAQSPEFAYTVSDEMAMKGSIFTQTVSLATMQTNVPFGNVSGWSMSVCHDPATQDVVGAETPQFVYDLTYGFGFHFHAFSIDDAATNIPGSSDGANQGVVLPNGFFFFPNNAEGEVFVVSYVALTDTGTSTTHLCSAVGSPNVETVVVCCGGASVPVGPNLSATSGVVSYSAGVPLWAFSGEDIDVEYHTPTGDCLSNCEFSVNLDIASTPANSTHSDTAGFSMSLLHDDSLLTPTAIHVGSTPAALVQHTGSTGPDIVLMNITTAGVSIHVQNTVLPHIPVLPYHLQSIDWGSGGTAAVVDYVVTASSLTGNLGGTTSTLSWGDIGDGVGNAVTVHLSPRNLVGLSDPDVIDFDDIDITFVPVTDLDFVRSDCNNDGGIDIADVVWLISGYLATPAAGPEGSCAAACDGNGDGSIDVADVSFLLAFHFAGGPAPPAPFPECGAIRDAPCEASICP